LLQRILPLRGAIQNYDWGSRTALAALLGRSAPSARPEAELWLGAHPNGPAEVRVDARWERLDALVERNAEALLGAPSLAAFGRRLPFLLKVLAVERPLSLQVHPDATQARDGFARQQECAEAPRLFVDPGAKPELVCALTPFTALCGLRPLEDLRAQLAGVGLDALVPAGEHEPTVFAGFLGSWLRAPLPERRAALRRALEHAERIAEAGDPECASLLALAAEHRDDPGVLAPLFLHRVELRPGEALYLPPGELHCYLRGVAVELMASSDNVVRGGLTRKDVDTDALLRITRLTSRRPPILRAEPRARGESVWRTPAQEFELSLLDSQQDDRLELADRAGAEILWCCEGALQLASAAGKALVLGRGEACLVPASAGAYRVQGAGRAFRAALPAR
jgi:mannose-6-phosphate isomerase